MYISRSSKSKIYQVYYRKKDGKKTRISTKTKFKKDALKFLSKFQDELKNRNSSNTITLGQLRIKYLASIEATHTSGSQKHSRKCIENFIKYLGEDVLINKITKEQIEIFIHTIFKRAKYSASLHLRSLKAVFNKAIDWGYLEKNNFTGIHLRIPTNNPIFINKDELQLIVEKETNPILASLYKFAFYTGMRRGEILNLEWQDIDMNNKIIRLKNKDGFTTKSKKERVIPINDLVYDMLINIEKDSRYVFNKERKQFNPPYVCRAFKKALRKTNLNEQLKFHSLRHSFASNLVQRGVNLYLISKLLGHSSIKVTEVYSHLKVEDQAKAVNEL